MISSAFTDTIGVKLLLCHFVFVFCFNFCLPSVHGQGLQGFTYNCNSDCNIDESCVPDLSPTFGKLLAHHYSGSFPFRCQYEAQETFISTSQEGDRNYGDDDPTAEISSFIASSGCPYDCQNGGKCISILGGLSYACICTEPFWGMECEVDGSKQACELECVESVDGVLQPRKGAFCVESPENLVSGVDSQSCVHCEELLKEEEPICEDLMDCKNGGVCHIEYQFVTDNFDEGSAASERPFKCYSSTTELIFDNDGIPTKETLWTALSPYKVSCDCPPGFQGTYCEEIDACGTGCQNNGYCISEDTPDDKLGSNDFFNIYTDNLQDDDDDSHTHSTGNVDGAAFHEHSRQIDCTSCFEGRCDQATCGPRAACLGGMCNQDYLIRPMCPGGKCSQRYARYPSCVGGDCDQTAAVEATCTGSDCFQDGVDAQTLMPDTNTMSPNLEPFCSCEYGYVGEQCEHPITAICIFDAFEHNQFLHEVCLQLGKLCPLVIGNRFCTNGGSCGNAGIGPSNDLHDKTFTCICPIGFEGVHCQIIQTPIPKLEPNEPILSSSSSTRFGNEWYSCMLILLFISARRNYSII